MARNPNYQPYTSGDIPSSIIDKFSSLLAYDGDEATYAADHRESIIVDQIPSGGSDLLA